MRTLNLGFKPQGFYMTRSRAAYWDGRNNLGEQVASGVYFYGLQTPDFSADTQDADFEVGKLAVELGTRSVSERSLTT